MWEQTPAVIPHARLRPGPGFELSRAALYYSQRLVTYPRLRRMLAGAIATAIKIQQPKATRPAAHATLVRPALAALRHSGIAMLPELLTEKDVRAMTEFLLEQDVVGPDGFPVPLPHLPSGVPMAAYPLAPVLNCPGVLKLVSKPDILDLAAAYLGCSPILSSIGIRWSFPIAGPEADSQLFHRDVDDWRFFKLFVYLTDVDEESGAHVYIDGTHVTPARWLARPYSMDEIERNYGTGRARVITGPPGTSFVADTYGVHRGLAPTARPRLVLQAQYSLLPIYAFNYKPVALSGYVAGDTRLFRLLVT